MQTLYAIEAARPRIIPGITTFNHKTTGPKDAKTQPCRSLSNHWNSLISIKAMHQAQKTFNIPDRLLKALRYAIREGEYMTEIIVSGNNLL